MLNVEKIRKDFPQIDHKINGSPIIYLDNAATTLKPQAVIDSLLRSNAQEASNIHRGIHTLSEQGTEKYEYTRTLLHEFINSKYREEIIFTKGTTESINLIAYSHGDKFLSQDDEILITELEHHSNIVPWQLLCERKGAKLKVLPINDEGELLIDQLPKLLSDKTKLVSFNFISNSLGTINPAKDIIKQVRKNSSAVVHIDAAQASAHTEIDVQKLDCDFLSLSAHKMFGPTGCGLLYGKKELLENMSPFLGGGDMIDQVSFEKTTFNELPYKFEAGTPNISNIIAWAEAIKYVQELDFSEVAQYENDLLSYANQRMLEVPGLKLIGTSKSKSSVISFTMDGLHPHDIATMLNKYNIAIRTGHHCTQPLMRRLGVPATARASFSIYNTREEIDALVESLKKIQELFC